VTHRQGTERRSQVSQNLLTEAANARCSAFVTYRVQE
jgi:hypothetical protein